MGAGRPPCHAARHRRHGTSMPSGALRPLQKVDDTPLDPQGAQRALGLRPLPPPCAGLPNARPFALRACMVGTPSCAPALLPHWQPGWTSALLNWRYAFLFEALHVCRGRAPHETVDTKLRESVAGAQGASGVAAAHRPVSKGGGSGSRGREANKQCSKWWGGAGRRPAGPRPAPRTHGAAGRGSSSSVVLALAAAAVLLLVQVVLQVCRRAVLQRWAGTGERRWMAEETDESCWRPAQRLAQQHPPPCRSAARRPAAEAPGPAAQQAAAGSLVILSRQSGTSSW